MVAINTQNPREIPYLSTSTLPATLGADTPVSANIRAFVDQSDILDLYFDFTQTGTRLRSGVYLSSIPLAAFEYAWATRSRDYNGFLWQVADLSILHEGRFSWGDCQRVMALTGIRLELSTAETISSYARNVPYEVRVPYEVNGVATGISIWWHAHVSMLPVEAQQALLARCVAEDMSYAKFKQACQDWRESHQFKPVVRRPKPTAARDIIFQQMVELGAAEVERDKALAETSQLEQTVTATAAALRSLALDVARLLAVT